MWSGRKIYANAVSGIYEIASPAFSSKLHTPSSPSPFHMYVASSEAPIPVSVTSSSGVPQGLSCPRRSPDWRSARAWHVLGSLLLIPLTAPPPRLDLGFFPPLRLLFLPLRVCQPYAKLAPRSEMARYLSDNRGALFELHPSRPRPAFCPKQAVCSCKMFLHGEPPPPPQKGPWAGSRSEGGCLRTGSGMAGWISPTPLPGSHPFPFGLEWKGHSPN
ncbi:hypothetical protein LX36DRAFT_438682 [Colletotrichum falcatum]|nr:hypothetical protein LX36DRAFT_438682 [Colletotrichum falcatum]